MYVEVRIAGGAMATAPWGMRIVVLWTARGTTRPTTPISTSYAAGCRAQAVLSRVKQLAGFVARESWALAVGQAVVDVVRPVPGQGLVRADGVVADPVALRVHGQVEDILDLLEKQPLVLQRAEPALT